VASAVRAGEQGETIAAFLSLIQTEEDIGIDKARTDRLGVGEWLAGHRGPSITLLMRQNRDAMVFGRMSGS